jgi:hypothetical protein
MKKIGTLHNNFFEKITIFVSKIYTAYAHYYPMQRVRIIKRWTVVARREKV